MHGYEGNKICIANFTVLYHSIPDKYLINKQKHCIGKEELTAQLTALM
jgi:hypothetical protein